MHISTLKFQGSFSPLTGMQLSTSCKIETFVEFVIVYDEETRIDRDLQSDVEKKIGRTK